MAGSLNVNTSESVRARCGNNSPIRVCSCIAFQQILRLHRHSLLYRCYTALGVVAATVAQPLRAAPYPHVAGS